jgi:hypothetical protein
VPDRRARTRLGEPRLATLVHERQALGAQSIAREKNHPLAQRGRLTGQDVVCLFSSSEPPAEARGFMRVQRLPDASDEGLWLTSLPGAADFWPSLSWGAQVRKGAPASEKTRRGCRPESNAR